MLTLFRPAAFALLSGVLMLGGPPQAAAQAVDNVAPLAFGMTPESASAALGTPLVYISGPRDSEIFTADRPSRMPGLYPAGVRFSLQFRHGRLAGWKRQWLLDRPAAF